jgi:hypothetical protein
MKVMKTTLVLAAIVFGTLGAMAGKKFKAVCEQEQQYMYSSAAGYQPVSNDYYCITGGSGIYCTYYISKVAPITYTVCTYGTYTDPAK